MHKEVAAWLESTEKRIKDAVNETVRETAPDAAGMIQTLIPANRRKTVDSVRHKMIGPRMALVGLFFATKYYANKNSFTFRHFRTVWRDQVRPRIVPRLIKRLNKKLQS